MLRTSAPPATTAAAVKASPWGTWHGADTGPTVRRAEAEVAAHPSWYRHGTPSHRHSGTHPTSHRHGRSPARPGQRLVVYPAELADVVSRLRSESELAGYVGRGIARHEAELDAVVAGDWMVPDMARLNLVRRQLAEARTGPRSATAASSGLADTASWVSTFRSQVLAADGPGERRSPPPRHATHPHQPDRHPAESSRTRRVHRMLATAQAQPRRHVTDGGTNHTPCGAWFGSNGVAWCAQFVSWVFAHSGNRLPSVDGPPGKGFQYCPDALRYARAHGQLHMTPRVGDIMLYADGDHTGIVTAVHAGGGFETIEGNAGPGDTTVVHNHRQLHDNARHGGYRFWTAIH